MCSFPLFRLPNVPLREVLSYLDPIQLLEFSLCSKKVHNHAKSIKKSDCLRMEIIEFRSNSKEIILSGSEDYFQQYKLYISDYEGQEQFASYDGTVNGHRVKFEPKRDELTLTTYWNDTNIGMTELSKYIGEIFNYPIISNLSLTPKTMNYPFMHFMNNTFSGRVKFFDADTRYLENPTYEDMKFMLDNCKMAEIVYFYQSFPEFRYEFDFNLKEIFVQFAQWITFDHLNQLSNQSVVVSFHETSLTSKQLNLFLQKWTKSETVLKMKRLKVGENLNPEDVLSGILREERDPEKLTRFRISDDHIYHIRGGFNIRRNDGVIASIVFQEMPWNLGNFNFEMIIWPDVNGSMEE